MSITHESVTALKSHAAHPGVELNEDGPQFELRVRRDSILIVVTVPKEVLEWFVDASDDTTGRSASDWFDYCGYDNRPLEQLAVEMAQHVHEFVQSVITRPLRFTEQKGHLHHRDARQASCGERSELGRAKPAF